VAGGGTQTAAIATGGETPRTGVTELYDGTSWTEVNDLNTARNQLALAGNQTASVAFGGEAPGPSTVTELWDGSTWTSNPTGLNTATRENAGFGTQTAAVSAGGFAASPPYLTVTETWNGSAWSTSPNSLPTGTGQLSGIGTATAGLVMGGYAPGGIAGNTFEWDGSAWTVGGTMNTPRANFCGSGIQTNGIIAGGALPPGSTYTNAAEGYDGSVWSTRPGLTTTRLDQAGLGEGSTADNALVAGGYLQGGPSTTATEEFTGETVSNNPASNLSVS